MGAEDIDYVMSKFIGRDLLYYKVVLKDDSYKLYLQRLEDKYPTSQKYSPNNVTYDEEELLKLDKFIDGVGYKYRSIVEEALNLVSREPFVTEIYQLLVTDDQKYPHIIIWTYINQDGNFRPVRSFEYDVIDGTLVRCKYKHNDH